MCVRARVSKRAKDEQRSRSPDSVAFCASPTLQRQQKDESSSGNERREKKTRVPPFRNDNGGEQKCFSSSCRCCLVTCACWSLLVGVFCSFSLLVFLHFFPQSRSRRNCAPLAVLLFLAAGMQLDCSALACLLVCSRTRAKHVSRSQRNEQHIFLRRLLIKNQNAIFRIVCLFFCCF